MQNMPAPQAVSTRKKPKSLLVLLVATLKVFFRQNPWLFIGYTLFSALDFFSPRAEAFVTGKLIDQALILINAGATSITRDFFVLLVILVLTRVLTQLVTDLSNYIQQIVNTLAPVYQDRILLGKYLAIEPKAFELPSFVLLRNKVEQNFFKVFNALGRFNNIIAGLIAAVPVGILLAQYSIWLVVFSLVSVVPGIVLQLFFGKKVWSIWDSSGEEKVKYQSYRRPLFASDHERIQEIKILGYGKYLLDKAIAYNQKFLQQLVNNENRRMIYSVFCSIFEYILVAVGYYLIFNLLFQKSVTVGDFYFITSLFGGLRSSLGYSLRQMINIQADVNVLAAFHEILEYENTIVPGSQVVPGDLPVRIEFRNVWFKYPATHRFVIKDLNLTIESDEDVALVGKNGAGKTTLIKLLMRIYDPDRGDIFVNGVNLRELKLEEYYKLVGILAQEFNTLGVTAGENIYVGDIGQKYDAEKIKRAAIQAQAHGFIQKYEKGYETFMSREIDGGMMPSGGQKQRLAIARVFFREPRLIVLDEPTSAIDSIAEQQIFENIQRYSKGRTVLIVSHRCSTVKRAHRIIVLDQGKVIEEGSHKQLLKRVGLYAEMYDKQAG
jgi:ATP-binding cassette subfamily B protein